MNSDLSGVETDVQMQPHFTVSLRKSTLKPNVAAPKGYKIVGMVYIGMEFGLLGSNEAGDFFRINGAQVEQLDTQRVESALRAVQRAQQDSVPVVTVRKRRHVVLPGGVTHAPRLT